MDGEIIIKTSIDNTSFDKQIELLTDKLERLLEEYDAIEKADPFDGQNDELIKIQNEIDSTRKKITKLKTEQKGIDFSNWGNGIERATKKIAKMALAVFGIRSAYMFVRNAINTIASQDEQLKADIDAIKVALAYTIEPIVRGIVNLVKTLMGYIAYIIKAWTGRDIFAKAKNNLASANKSAKELQKTSASFDKFNKIGGSNTSGGGTGGVSAELNMPTDEKMEGTWIGWIAQNGDLVKGTLWGIAGALVGIKLGMSGIQATGFFVFVLSIYELAQSIIKYLQDPSWENFGKIIFWISGAVMGLGIMFGSLPLIIAGAIGLIIGIIAMFWDKIEGFLTKLQDSIYNVGDKIMNWINEKCGSIGSIINVVIGTIIGVVTSSIELVKDSIGGVFKFVKSILDSIILLFKGDFKGALKSVLKAIGNLIIDMLNALGSALNVVISPIRALVVAVGKVTGQNWTMKNIKIPKIPRLAQGGIVHNPGSGVMMGSYIAGEGRNPEAVIPLDDATLDRLGQAIARHSQINATIVNEMDGRVLSKNLARVHSENAFARNGGY